MRRFLGRSLARTSSLIFSFERLSVVDGGMTSRRPQRRLLDVGGFRAVKIGTPSAASDLYYATMAMSWPAFVAMVTASFLVINAAFGILYALLPGAIANAVPGSLADGFFFSV